MINARKGFLNWQMFYNLDVHTSYLSKKFNRISKQSPLQIKGGNKLHLAGFSSLIGHRGHTVTSVFHLISPGPKETQLMT